MSGVVAIAAGAQHSLALLSDGEVTAWGENWDGQLGTGNTISTDTPVPVPGLIDVSEIAAVKTGASPTGCWARLGPKYPD